MTAAFHVLRFGRAAGAYENEAGVQARMADRLLRLPDPDSAPSRILEFGCGTGLLTRRLRRRFPEALLCATDASESMLAQARRNLEPAENLYFLPQEASGAMPPSPALPRKPFDLLASNALVQWFPDLAAHLRFAAALAAPGAFYLMSGFARGNFPELNALLAAPPFDYRDFPGQDRADVDAAAMASGWRLRRWEPWEESETAPSARAVLDRIRSLGSARHPAGSRLTPRTLAGLLAAYEERHGGDGGVRMTWKPWAAWLRREG